MLIQLLIALPIALLVNTLLGVAIAKTKLEFNKKILGQGLFKGVCIYTAIGGLVLIATILPVIEVEGLGQLDIQQSLTIIVSTILGLYVYQDLQKLTQVLKLKNSTMMMEQIIDDANQNKQ